MKNKIFAIITILFVFISMTIIMEFGFRVYENILENKRNVRLMQHDDELGWRMLPNIYDIKTIDGDNVVINTNSAGWAYPEEETGFSVKKKSSLAPYKIIVIGDSFTEGAYTTEGYDTAYPNLIRLNLLKKGYLVKIINFGVGGYGFDNYEAIVKKYLKKEAPDLVILGTFNGNDFRDTYYGMYSNTVVKGAVIRADTEKDGDINRQLAKRKLKVKLNDNFATYRFFRPLIKRVLLLNKSIATKLELVNNKSYFDKYQINYNQMDFNSYSVWSRITYTKTQEDALLKSLAHLDSIRKLVSDYGSELMVVSIPYAEQVYNKTAINDSHSIEFPQEYIRDFCNKNKIYYLDLLPDFRRSNDMKYYWLTDPHFNDFGHKKAAQIISTYLVSSGLLSVH